MGKRDINQKKHKNKLVLFRHRVTYFFLRPLFKLYLTIKYNFTRDKYRGKDKEIIILSNHVTTLDPMFLATSFKFPIYFVASDQIFNLGFASRIIKYLVSPIPKEKGISDLQTIKDIVAYSKEGGAVGIFPEGNRTFTGKTCTIPPQIGKLLKLLKKTVVIYNLEGGYLSKPRYCDKVRRGKMRGCIKEVWNFEDYKDLTSDEIYQRLKTVLYVDSYETEKVWKIKYKSKHHAEYLENVLYLCPHCKKLHTLKSSGNFYRCNDCGAEIECTEFGLMKSTDGKISFQSVDEWFLWQVNYMIANKLFENHCEKPIISNDAFKIYSNVRGEKRRFLDSGTLSLFSDRFEFSGKIERVFKICDVQEVAPQTMGKVQLYTKSGEMFILIGDVRSYSLSFVTIFYMIKNEMEGIGNEFLGI